MSTRKLILTALLCGLAIMLAGGAKLFLIATEDTEAQVNELRVQKSLGDMKVSVLSVTQDADATVVKVSMQGVEGADAIEGWRLLAGGEVLSPSTEITAGLAAPCTATHVAKVVECQVGFVATTGTATVAYLRAGQQTQWRSQP